MSTTTQTTLKLGPDDAGVQLSHQQFATADFAEPFTYERVKWRLVVLPPAGPEHRNVSRAFRHELGGYWYAHPDLVHDVDVDVEGWLVTSSDDDRIPDIYVYLAESSPDEQVPQRIPDLIYEFVSASRSDQERDYVHKRAEYHAIGVKEYVIVDRFKQSVLVLTWQADDFSEEVLRGNANYTTLLLPGLKVPLADVFE